jgi:ESS family glutamate:Na+ symporter
VASSENSVRLFSSCKYPTFAVQLALLMAVQLSPWCLLALAVPIVLAGDLVVRRVRILSQFNIPGPVVGGLGFSLLVLLLSATGVVTLSFQTKVTAGGWTWLVTPDFEWLSRPAKSLNQPLLVGFFTCVGLAAPVRVLRDGGRALVVLLGGATVLAVVQNIVGVALAHVLGAPPLLGVICGALTLVGGHGTALGFASRFEEAGFPAAAAMGAAAATFGLIAGGLLAGPLAEWLLRRLPAGGHEHAANNPAPGASLSRDTRSGFALFEDIRAVVAGGRDSLRLIIVVAACVKAGAWVSFGLEHLGASFPVYMGALLVGFAVRAIHDGTGSRWLQPQLISRIAAVLLAVFLAVTLSALNLADLASVAGPMLVILTVNTIVSLAFAAFVIWPLLGRNYEGGVMVAGLIGFGVGSTATAVAAMDAIARRRGPAPKAFALVPPIGGFLIDLTNAPVIAGFIRLFR